jgi:uncharacterized membrane protein YbaN (DUF454 family)
MKRISEKVKRLLFIILGTLFLGIGCIGIILPILPTTPFLLLAAACYVRGSNRIYRWMMRNRLFGEFIKNYLEGKGIKSRQKVITLVFLWVMIIFTTVYMIENMTIRILLLIIAFTVSVHILTLPTLQSAF